MSGKQYRNGFAARSRARRRAKPPPRAIAIDEERGPNAAGQDTYLGQLNHMDEDFEKQIVGRNQPGTLVNVPGHRPSKHGAGSRVGVHGIKGSPNDVAHTTKLGLDKRQDTSVFAYDDKARRLDKVSDDLVQSLLEEMKANPDGPLNVDAHSMGTRVTIDAIRKLVESGQLGDREINLNLMAPILAGMTKNEGLTNAAGTAFPPFDMFNGVRPGKDMGTNSDFQKQLEKAKFPENVRTRLFTGGKDDLVDTQDPRWIAMKEQLNAKHVHFDKADHDGVVAEAADWLRKNE